MPHHASAQAEASGTRRVLRVGVWLVTADSPRHIRDLFAPGAPATMRTRSIATGEHCFGCTAGCGSSCGGALAGARP